MSGVAATDTLVASRSDPAVTSWLTSQVRRVQKVMDCGTDEALLALITATFDKGVEHGMRLALDQAISRLEKKVG